MSNKNLDLLHMNYLKRSLLFLPVLFLTATLSSQTNNVDISVNSPTNIQGVYEGFLGVFGVTQCELTTVTGELKLIEDSTGGSDACDVDSGESLEIVNDLSGAIALIDRDGVCSFASKAEASLAAGAIAVIVCNNNSEITNPGGDSDIVNIPIMMISKSDCELIKAELGNTVNITIAPSDFSIPDDFADDKIVWGADGEGAFDGDLGSWTTQGLSDESHLWSWSEDGSGDGVLFSGPVDSKTTCNGAAIFDFDFIQTGGLEENLPDGNPPRISGELISPTIDLSAFKALALKFYQHNVPLNGTNQFATSIDGGTTWSDPIDITTENVLTADSTNLAGTELKRIPLSNVAGESDVKIKFIAEGDFYFWSIDDVQIVELEGINVSVSSVFYTPVSFAIPKSHADADTFSFSAAVTNNGGEVIANAQLDVEILNEETGASVFTTSGSVSNIAVGTTTNITANDSYVPVGLDPGIYSMNYSVSVLDAFEQLKDDNTSQKFFQITENTFAKEFGPTTFLGGPALEGTWGAGAIYPISNNVTDFVATNATIAVATNSDALTDNYVDIFLLKLKAGIQITSDNFDFFETDIFGHPAFDVISQNTHVFTDEENGALVEVPFSSSAQGVPLEPGGAYIVMIRLDENQVGSAPGKNSDLFIGFSEDERIIQQGDVFGFVTQLILVESDERWYTGIGAGGVAVLRMSVDMISDVDDTPLPVGSFEVFPNPASDYINVEFDLEEPTDATIIMASLDGKIIKVEELNNVSKRSLDISVADLAAGTYILKAYTANGSTTHKIVVAH